MSPPFLRVELSAEEDKTLHELARASSVPARTRESCSSEAEPCGLETAENSGLPGLECGNVANNNLPLAGAGIDGSVGSTSCRAKPQVE